MHTNFHTTEHNKPRQKSSGILIHLDFDRLLAADLEWVLRVADYALQEAIAEKEFGTRWKKEWGPTAGRFGRLSIHSFEIRYAKTEHSIDIFLKLIEGVAAAVIYDFLKTVWRKLKERKKRGVEPRKSRATKESLAEGRIRKVIFSRVVDGKEEERLVYWEAETTRWKKKVVK